MVHNGSLIIKMNSNYEVNISQREKNKAHSIAEQGEILLAKYRKKKVLNLKTVLKGKQKKNIYICIG